MGLQFIATVPIKITLTSASEDRCQSDSKQNAEDKSERCNCTTEIRQRIHPCVLGRGTVETVFRSSQSNLYLFIFTLGRDNLNCNRCKNFFLDGMLGSASVLHEIIDRRGA